MESVAHKNLHEQPHILVDMVGRLQRTLGPKLDSVVLHGSTARGESYAGPEHFQLLLVLADLEPLTMRALSEPVRFWLRRGAPMPRLFSRELIATAADVFPLEFLEIQSNHMILLGSDPFVGLEIHKENLRLQCEREFREKMMRLREGYLECRGTDRQIRRLLRESYPDFVEIFRGCLRLGPRMLSLHDDEIVWQFCRQAGIMHEPFSAVEEMVLRKRTRKTADEVFAAYYEELTRALATIDRFATGRE